MADQYEFTDEQNQQIASLASAMKFVGFAGIAMGTLYGMVGFMSLKESLSSAAAHFVNAGLTLAMGLFVMRASSAFARIVNTKGEDISLLMRALINLRQLFSLWRVLIVLEGRAAGEALGQKGAPVDAAIVGIIDAVDLDGDV